MNRMLCKGIYCQPQKSPRKSPKIAQSDFYAIEFPPWTSPRKRFSLKRSLSQMVTWRVLYRSISRDMRRYSNCKIDGGTDGLFRDLSYEGRDWPTYHFHERRMAVFPDYFRLSLRLLVRIRTKVDLQREEMEGVRPWLPNGYSQIFRLYSFGPSRFQDGKI